MLVDIIVLNAICHKILHVWLLIVNMIILAADSHMRLKILEASSAEGVNTYSLLGRLRGYFSWLC